MRYCALIGDIIGSRELAPEARSGLQARLKHVLEEINEEFKMDIAAQFLITLGDEFQGLLYLAEPVLEIIERIDRAAYPSRIRYGIGIGELSTPVADEAALGADGPAYHLARDGVDALRAQRTQGFPVLVRTGGPEEHLLDGLCLLLNEMASSWSEKQRECVRMMRQLGEQLAVAERLDMAPSTVSRTLARARYGTWERALGELAAYLAAQDDSAAKDIPRVYGQCLRLMAQDRFAEAAQKLSTVLSAAGIDTLPRKQQCILRQLSGELNRKMGDVERAVQELRRALTLAQESQWAQGQAVVLNSLALCQMDQKAYGEAGRTLDQVEALAQSATVSDTARYTMQGNRAVLYELMGDRDKAIEAEQALLAQMQQNEVDDPLILGNVYFNLGNSLLKQKKREDGVRYVEQSLGYFQQACPETDLKIAKAYTLLAVTLDEHDPKACEYLKKALGGYQKNRRWDMVERVAQLLQQAYQLRDDEKQAAEYARLAKLAAKKAKQCDTLQPPADG